MTLWGYGYYGPLFLIILSFLGQRKFASGFNVNFHAGESQRLNNLARVFEPRRFVIRDLFLGTASAVTSLFVTNFPASAKQPQYETAADIPEEMIDRHEIIYGFVERVIDGDTIRIRHIPDYYLSPGKDIDLSTLVDPTVPVRNSTIVVRMYGIDAPETAKKKSETSQPFGEEAKQLTKDLVLHKVVTVKLLKKDRYQRILGEVETFASNASPGVFSPPKDVSVELASRGLATLYTGGGAQYDVSDHGKFHFSCMI